MKRKYKLNKSELKEVKEMILDAPKATDRALYVVTEFAHLVFMAGQKEILRRKNGGKRIK